MSPSASFRRASVADNTRALPHRVSTARLARIVLMTSAGATALLRLTTPAVAADLVPAMPVKVPPIETAYDWTGFYVGGHFGQAWGSSNWAASTIGGTPVASGSLNLYESFDAFKESGSIFAGVQAGYNYTLPSRLVVGAEVDASFPSFPDLNGISIGGIQNFNSAALGPESYSETVLSSGTVRGRIGYAPGSWLFYATGGFAWTYDQLTVTQLANGTVDSPFLWRFGFAAGAGVEAPVAPHWTARLEYLYTDYGVSNVTFPFAGQRVGSDFVQQEVRAGLNYQFADNPTPIVKAPSAPTPAAPDWVNFHGQTTFVEQAYPKFRAPYDGPNSLPGSGQGRETIDATLYAGVRLWEGAEAWFNPEIDQGMGLAQTHGVAGFPSAESYKLGSDYPYARINRAFVRQTIDLGGATEKVDADINQFAGSRTADRLVLTVGRFSIVDIFDTNRYANNAKTDFLNWSVVNAGSFDYAGDGWAYTYGAAAEWYQGRWTLRGGVFDLSATPPGGVSPLGAFLDPTFGNFEMVGEIEERHELWGQPGKIKITGFLERGRMGAFADAIALAQLTGQPADITAVRTYTSRPGVSLNLEQQVTEALGVFARAGWDDGNLEPWDNTDIDRTVEAGVSVSGKLWGRPDDTIGAAGVVNGISNIHVAFLNAGGLGVLIGDGQLPHPGLEQIFETYYSYALTPSTHVSVDYQFIANPAYNTDRGPVNVFATRVHTQF
jgi:high affinity Mn2+ porin